MNRIETITLDDGRRAERHVTFDAKGNEVVEIFAEEKRPLKLEKRISREMKQIVAKEIHETIKDGEVAYQEVRSLEADVPLQVRQKIGVVDHAKIVDGDYVRKDEIQSLIVEGVVAGMNVLTQNAQPVEMMNAQSFQARSAADAESRSFSPRRLVEQNVQDKKKTDWWVQGILGGLIVLEMAFFGYIYFMP